MRKTEPLYRLLGITPGDLVSFTGGGGKTTMVYHLAEELSQAGGCAIVTTTTHMQCPYGFDGSAVVCPFAEGVAEAVPRLHANKVFIAATGAPGHKVRGFAPDEVDLIHERLAHATFLNEADGAAMKPYKFYRPYDPVLPDTGTVLVHVIGAETFGTPMTADLFHRCPPEWEGKTFDEDALDQALSWFVTNKLPEFSGRRVLVVNKADDGRQEAARTMAGVASRHFDACVVASLRDKRWELA